MSTAVHPVSGPYMHTQFDDTLADRLAVTENACLHLAQANADACLGYLVAHGIKPFGERFAAVVALVAEKFDDE